MMHQGGYTNLVVYLAQQIYQFRLRGKEFAMQHLGSEDQMQQVLRDILATLPPEERLEGMPPKERLQGLAPEDMQQVLREFLATLPPEERLKGLSLEERIKDLSPEELERLRQLLQTRTKANNSSRPE
jgi:hypothetical protein